jgi:hypothetical protein
MGNAVERLVHAPQLFESIGRRDDHAKLLDPLSGNALQLAPVRPVSCLQQSKIDLTDISQDRDIRNGILAASRTTPSGKAIGVRKILAPVLC